MTELEQEVAKAALSSLVLQDEDGEWLFGEEDEVLVVQERDGRVILVKDGEDGVKRYLVTVTVQLTDLGALAQEL